MLKPSPLSLPHDLLMWQFSDGSGVVLFNLESTEAITAELGGEVTLTSGNQSANVSLELKHHLQRKNWLSVD